MQRFIAPLIMRQENLNTEAFLRRCCSCSSCNFENICATAMSSWQVKIRFFQHVLINIISHHT